MHHNVETTASCQSYFNFMENYDSEWEDEEEFTIRKGLEQFIDINA